MRLSRVFLGTIATVSLLAAAPIGAQDLTKLASHAEIWAQGGSFGSWQGMLNITVTGEARGKPDVMCLELLSEAVAGNASDALRQCKEKADAAAKAIEALRIPDAKIARDMYEFTSPVTTNLISSMRGSAAPAGTRVVQTLKVRVKMKGRTEADKLAETVARVLDAAGKSGVGIRQGARGPAEIFGENGAPPVTYLMEDAQALAERAMADAFRKADEIKRTLAASGVTPGKAMSVSCQQSSSIEDMMPWRRSNREKEAIEEKSAPSLSPEVVIVRRSLTLTYGLDHAKGK